MRDVRAAQMNKPEYQDACDRVEYDPRPFPSTAAHHLESVAGRFGRKGRLCHRRIRQARKMIRENSKRAFVFSPRWNGDPQRAWGVFPWNVALNAVRVLARD